MFLHVLLSLCAGRYQANPANAVFQFFHNEEVRMHDLALQLQQQHCCFLQRCSKLQMHDQLFIWTQ
jgi:hypothetical protein